MKFWAANFEGIEGKPCTTNLEEADRKYIKDIYIYIYRMKYKSQVAAQDDTGRG